MAGTFSQIYIHLVFAVQDRESLIQSSWEEELYKYTTGIVQNHKQKMLAINGMPGHIHLFLNVRPSCRIADLVREIKKSTNEWVNEQRFTSYKFKWQEGYGAFSHGHGSVSNVISYVTNQKNTIVTKHFKKNIWGFSKSLISHIKMRIYFIGSNNMRPLRGRQAEEIPRTIGSAIRGYRHSIPSGSAIHDFARQKQSIINHIGSLALKVLLI